MMKTAPQSAGISIPEFAKQRLVCPACKAPLDWHEQASPPHVDCTGCGRSYPFEDGIPVLLVERTKFRD
jgi:uncharacterized protein